MSERARRRGWSSTRLIALALIAGIVAGVAMSRVGGGAVEGARQVASLAGGLWLDALRMTIIPLLFALLVKGVMSGAAAARGSRIAARALLWFLGLSFCSAVIGAVVSLLLLAAFPLSPAAIAALRGALGSADLSGVGSGAAGAADFFRSFIPVNPVKAAAEGAVLQVMVFGLVFALALTQLNARLRDPVVGFFDAVGQAMIVIVGWILLAAPLGVFALAFGLGAGAGTGAFGALAHYLAIYMATGIAVLGLAYIVALGIARLPAKAFARAMLPAQSFALSTQSSTASLPLMLGAARELEISEASRDVVLPMAVALFRVLGPAMNIAVCFYVAHWLGIELSLTAMVAGVAVATLASISAPGLPGQISFISSIAPIAVAMGLPLAPLGIFIAVEPIPDMLRTLTNVTMDVAVAGAVDSKTREETPKQP